MTNTTGERAPLLDPNYTAADYGFSIPSETSEGGKPDILPEIPLSAITRATIARHEAQAPPDISGRPPLEETPLQMLARLSHLAK